MIRYLRKNVKAIGRSFSKYLLDEKGRPLRDANGNKVLDPRGITTHSLRASMATLAVRAAGMPIEAVMMLGSWKTRRVAEGYRRTTSQQMIQAAAAISNVIKPKNRKPISDAATKAKA